MRGYWHVSRGKRIWVPSLLGTSNGGPYADSISFADLIEILHLDHFLTKGVAFRTLRTASVVASAELHTVHPFSTHRFRTDGRWILKEHNVDKKHPELYNILTHQLESRKLLRTLLKGELELDGHNIAQRWWPLKKNRDVVVDPTRRFGAPISATSGIPTHLLFSAYKAEGSYAAAASWYEVDRGSVIDAVAFERMYAA